LCFYFGISFSTLLVNFFTFGDVVKRCCAAKRANSVGTSPLLLGFGNVLSKSGVGVTQLADALMSKFRGFWRR